MISLQKYLPSFLAFLASVATIGWLGLFNSQQITDEFTWSALSTSTITVLIVLAVLILYVSLLGVPKDVPSYETFWGILVAWCFYALGEITWTGYYLIFRIDPPYPSIADLFWAIGTILLINELYLFTTNFKASIKRSQLIKAFIAAGAVILAIYVIAFNNIVLSGYDETYTPFQKAMDIFYFTADALIIFFSIYIAFALFSSIQSQFKEGFSFKNVPWGWVVLIIGMFLMIMADTYFTYLEWLGDPTLYRIDDALYVLQYYFWALGALLLPKTMVQEQQMRENESITSPTSESGDVGDHLSVEGPQPHAP